LLIRTVKALQIYLPIKDKMFQKKKLANLQEIYTNNKKIKDRNSTKKTKINQLLDKKNKLKKIPKPINLKENYMRIDLKVKFR
jgi:hypothetical protein